MSACLPIPARDFEAARELVWHSDRSCFVVRQRQAPNEGGAHVYHAFELACGRAYGELGDGLRISDVFGRVDTLKPEQAPAEYSDAVAWLMANQRRARDIIRELCPETAPGEAVYDGPGYVTMLTRPERRHAAVMASRRPF